MPDLQKLQENKEKIISTIREKGPSFPARIAREVNLSPLFISAILSELVSEKTLKISNMKVGSSPIYHLPDQKDKLSEFSNYLNNKEKEAFNLLKQEELIKDDDQEPAIRVALRSIKDFAVPINVRLNDEIKLFWKYFKLTDDEARNKIRSVLFSEQGQKKVDEINPLNENEISSKQEKNKEEQKASEIPQSFPKKEEKIISIKEDIFEKPKNKQPKVYKFPEKIKEYLTSREIEILEEISTKQKELLSKVRIDTQFGKQEFLLTAKEKKKITEEDLIIALQRAQSQKMPAIILSPGELDKNAKIYLQNWNNIIKFEKVKL